MDAMVLTVVFLPLLAAIVGGLGNRMLGNTVVKIPHDECAVRGRRV